VHSTRDSRCWKRISYKVRSSAVRQTATSSWYIFHSDNMPTASDGSDFATFVRMYKQWGESRNQRLEGNPHPLTGSQHPTNQVQRPIAQRLSPSRSRPQPQPYQQPPLRNPADVSILLQALDGVKKRQDEIYVTLNSLQTM
jgi:hypothetical protein